MRGDLNTPAISGAARDLWAAMKAWSERWPATPCTRTGTGIAPSPEAWLARQRLCRPATRSRYGSGGLYYVLQSADSGVPVAADHPAISAKPRLFLRLHDKSNSIGLSTQQAGAAVAAPTNGRGTRRRLAPPEDDTSISDALARLPAKSLCSFRCVSRHHRRAGLRRRAAAAPLVVDVFDARPPKKLPARRYCSARRSSCGTLWERRKLQRARASTRLLLECSWCTTMVDGVIFFMPRGHGVHGFINGRNRVAAFDLETEELEAADQGPRGYGRYL
ncbi:hypothetical protein HU200_042911 [Digitaria exilis]|uniref:F-box domain-containing protein n=1 Tax=Digitaria exilis TaxID=1010633 RepID=A0A835B195_9POAL|nr:hypothetical protein HU200_042911 [Digitaria exilis]